MSGDSDLDTFVTRNAERYDALVARINRDLARGVLAIAQLPSGLTEEIAGYEARFEQLGEGAERITGLIEKLDVEDRIKTEKSEVYEQLAQRYNLA